MALFGRRKKDAAAPEPEGSGDRLDTAESPVEPEGRGPWDADEVPELGSRIDLGAIRLPKRAGSQVKMELDSKTRRVVAVRLMLDASSLQLQAFAAPRSEGLWEELRGEIRDQVVKQGGSADERSGPFGRELLARLPARLPDGRTGSRPARFIGVDGPRWFLRAVVSGKATVDAEAAAALEDILADVVVVRGTDARPPRDLLTLHLPGRPAEAGPEVPGGRPSLDLPKRGPEITETR
ncbi:DUF3710 domain-containing protein [Occultella glacieicola]|uniref:DUF3710 domain-containing protein n=1 Tax=Occultella glacieicola TaxID=2518684 RepID=A0ABY2DXQ7_9MICO|nr:DUF3710 domain-containing protein [Occultella glacieicola]TDE88928.1 DUF3710 domain-containing protein [Occultella glacieicola]